MINRIRISEIFSSIQGEGEWVGQPSIFIRSFGCNLTCYGFNNGKDLMPVTRVKSLNDVSGDSFITGCDSQYAWRPEFKDTAKDYTETSLLDEISCYHANHLVLTGGEPLLYQNFYEGFLPKTDNRPITFETNGTIQISDKMRNILLKREHLMSVSVKLSSAGDPINKRIKLEALRSFEGLNTQFKYVCATAEDFEEVSALHPLYSKKQPLIMPVGNTYEVYRSNLLPVINLCMLYNFRFCSRLHLEAFGNSVGT